MPTSMLGFDCLIEQSFAHDEFHLWIGHQRPDGGLYFVKPVQLEIQSMTQQERGVATMERAEPSLRVPTDMMRAIMTSLWRRGERPNGVTDDSQRVALMEAHLADLREVIKNQQIVIRELNSIIAERVVEEPRT